MGNRAVITTKMGWTYQERYLGVYLHWNGGRDSIEGFLKYCEMRGFRSPEDDSYGWAYLAGVISNFFGNGLSVGIDTVQRLDTKGDNGVYIIENWKIVDRKNAPLFEQRNYDLKDVLLAIDKKQPKEYQIKCFLKAEPVDIHSLKVGDHVTFIDNIDGKCKEFPVVGIGEDTWENGTYCKDIPYVDRFGSGESAKNNCNNYLTNVGEVRLVKNPLTDEKLLEMWDEFGETPIDDRDHILEDFHEFEKGTDRFEVWHWFDEHYSKGVVELIKDYEKRF